MARDASLSGVTADPTVEVDHTPSLTLVTGAPVVARSTRVRTAWRRSGRWVVIAVLALGGVGVEGHTRAVQRGAEADRSQAAADRADAMADDDARAVLDDRARRLRSDEAVVVADLAAARDRLAQLEAEMGARVDREHALTDQVAETRADLDRAAAALASGRAVTGDVGACIEASQRALNLTSEGNDAGAREALARAAGPCGRAGGSSP